MKNDGTVSQLLGDPFGANTVSATVGRLVDLTLEPPVAPSKIIAVGLNYRAHAEESGMAIPDFPLLFYKPPSSLVGHNAPIVLPKISDEVEHECELAVVIGRTTRNISEDEALDAVFGYTCANDVSARDWQRAESQWVRGKGFDTFCPLGPWISTTIDPSSLDISTRVNGATRQSSNTSDMIFPIPRLIAEISQVMTLHPGDVIITGTPAGVGPLKAGDVVEVEIEKIGTLSNPVEPED